jgi:hypothetical protein
MWHEDGLFVGTWFAGAGGVYGKPFANWCQRPVPSLLSPGWFTCYCGCGAVGVCRHSVPDTLLWVPWRLCERAKHLVASGAYRCAAGRLVEVEGDVADDGGGDVDGGGN